MRQVGHGHVQLTARTNHSEELTAAPAVGKAEMFENIEAERAIKCGLAVGQRGQRGARDERGAVIGVEPFDAEPIAKLLNEHALTTACVEDSCAGRKRAKIPAHAVHFRQIRWIELPFGRELPMGLAALRVFPRPRDGRRRDRHGVRAAGVRPPGAVGCVPGDGDGPTGVIGTTLTPGRLTPDGGALGVGPLGPWAVGPDGFDRLRNSDWHHRRNLVIWRARRRVLRWLKRDGAARTSARRHVMETPARRSAECRWSRTRRARSVPGAAGRQHISTGLLEQRPKHDSLWRTLEQDRRREDRTGQPVSVHDDAFALGEPHGQDVAGRDVTSREGDSAVLVELELQRPVRRLCRGD